MSGKFLRTVALLGLALAASVSLPACKRGDSSSNPVTASSPKPQTPFERDLDYVRKGQFTYVFIFSRPDGGVFDKEDITYLKTNSPPETNQWIVTEDKRRVIAGTNFEFKPENFEALNKRFKVEDYSGK